MRPPARASITCAVALLAGTAAAQDLRLRDGPWCKRNPLVNDVSRGRIVALGTAGDCHEWDGQRWLHRPNASPPGDVFAMVHDPASRRTLALLYRSGVEVWDYDGDAWRLLAPATMPTGGGSRAALTFDAARGRPLLFGGQMLNRALDETWEWTGTTWVQLQPATSPPGRMHASMVFDAARSRAVLYGGASMSAVLGDTWEWDGSTWQQRQFAVDPGPRIGQAMGYHSSRQRVVLFDGNGLGDLWEYDGNSWQQQHPTGPTPTPRGMASLLDDPTSSELLLIGGIAGGVDARDAFRWNGARWQPHPGLPVMPPSRFDFACAEEPATGGVLMFGGNVGANGTQTTTNDTWRWDGRVWSRVTTAVAPSNRLGAAMWSNHIDVFLFGGCDVTQLGDTWRWTGSSWTAVPTAVAPPPRCRSPIAYDLGRGRAVLFGGYSANGLFGDTWTFDGTTWRQENPGLAPQPRWGHGLANDLLRNRVVLFGGLNLGVLLDDTWEWDGATWTPIATPSRPHAGHVVMGFDVQLARIVLAQRDPVPNGGIRMFDYDGVSWTPIALATAFPRFDPGSVVHRLQARRLDVFTGSAVVELSHAPAIAERFGTGCGVDPPAIAARSEPRLAASDFGLELVRTPPNAPVGIAGGTASASIAIGPCTQLVSPVLASVFMLANAGGFASLDVAIPGNAALLGATLFFQGAALDPSATAGFTTTAGLRVVVGD